MTSIIFVEGSSLVSIGYQSFRGTGLTSIIIPASLTSTSIGDYAFFGASSLTSIIIPANVNTIGTGAFLETSSLTSVTFEENSQLASIGASAFQSTALISITIPAGVIIIKANAFNSALSLNSVTFEAGSKLTMIEGYVFYKSALTSIIIPPNVFSIGSNAFAGSDLTTVYIADGQLTGISSPATDVIFFGATNVNTLRTTSTFTYSNGSTTDRSDTIITSSSYSVPSGYSLVSVSLGPFTTSIGDNAFQDASGLTSIIIPATVNSIGDNAFLNSGLSTVYIVDGRFGKPSPATGVSFFGATNVTTTYPSIPQTIYKYSDGTTEESTNIYIGTNYYNIPPGASLVGIIIGTTARSILNNTFQDASGLTSITITESVTSIGNNAFLNSGLSTVNLAYNQFGIISDTNVSFFGATVSIIFPPISETKFVYSDGSTSESTHTTITYSSYSNSIPSGSYLVGVYIATNVTSLGYQAFYNRTSMTSAVFVEGSQLTSIGDSAFNSTALTSIIIPASVVSIGPAAFIGVSSLSSVTFEENSQLVSIGLNGFRGASALTSINIPAGVNSIGTYAFTGATSLTSVTFEEISQLGEIPTRAFM